MEKATRRTTKEVSEGVEREMEYSALSSVELSEPKVSDGSVRVASVKVYANDPAEAGRQAVEVMAQVKASLNEAKGVKT